MSLLLCTSGAVSWLHWKKVSVGLLSFYELPTVCTETKQAEVLHCDEFLPDKLFALNECARQLLRWYECSTVYQPSCLHWKEVLAKLLSWDEFLQSTSQSVCTERKSHPICCAEIRFPQYTRQAVCTERKRHPICCAERKRQPSCCAKMSFLQCTSRAVCTERKRQQAVALWWIYDSVPAELFTLKG